MDIKLKAKLSAYSIVENLDNVEDDHVCPSIEPVTKEQIDNLFNDGNNSNSSTSYEAFTTFVDSLFAGDGTNV